MSHAADIPVPTDQPRLPHSSVPAQDALAFLWDKWKHHDTLIYSRWGTFWTVQAVCGGAIALVPNTPLAKEFTSVACAIVLVLLGLMSSIYTVRMMRSDRVCRNAFNGPLVSLLVQSGILPPAPLDPEAPGSTTRDFPPQTIQWTLTTWSPSLAEHPANRWHEYCPGVREKTALASWSAERQVLIIGVIETAAGLIWLLTVL